MKSSTRERLTVISKDGSGVAVMRRRPPVCLVMLPIAFMETMQLRDTLKNSSEIAYVYSEEKNNYLVTHDGHKYIIDS